MTFEWTAHRFSGGALAFDLVNTIICREQPDKRIDRLAGDEEVVAFAEAARRFRVAELGGKALYVPHEAAGVANVLALREAIDGYFRPLVRLGAPNDAALSRLFAAAAVASDVKKTPGNLGALAALSAMRLLGESAAARAKICPNCDWLFLDRSKNQSRLWCDMAVCGNRQKAKLHYSKQRAMEKDV